MNTGIAGLINIIVAFSTDYLMLLLLISFCVAVVLRILITIIVTRQKKFVLEFCKRVHHYNFLNPQPTGSFYSLVKRILATTYYENFDLRAKYMRRNGDQLMSVYDRIFLVQDGIIRLVNDFLKHVKFLHKDSRHQPNFTEIAANSFASNPVFNRVLGIFSMSRTNEILDILPGVFIVAGIFGTFLGIMNALPELTNMDIGDAAASKVVIDSFLISISFALTSSILGIILSILMTFINTILSPENTYMESVDSFKSATEILWNKCEDNVADKFDTRSEREKEAEEALEAAIANMYAKHTSSNPEMGPREDPTAGFDDVAIADAPPITETLETNENDLEKLLNAAAEEKAELEMASAEKTNHLESKLEELAVEHDQSTADLAALEERLNTAATEKAALEKTGVAEFGNLEEKYARLRTKSDTKQGELDALERNLESAAVKIAELEKASAESLEVFTTRYKDLEDDYTRKRGEAEEFRSEEIQTFENQQTESQARLRAMESQLNKAETEKVALAEQLQGGADEKAALENAGVAAHKNLEEKYAGLQE